MKNNQDKNFWIGIDIGKHGAICIQKSLLDIEETTSGRPDWLATTKMVNDINILSMPMIGTELDYVKLYHEILMPYEAGRGIVVFEKLGVIFGTSKATAFSMGHQAGAIEMACIGLSIPFTKVPPKVWQKEMFTGITEVRKTSKAKSGTSRDTKAMALLAVKQLFPQVKLTFGDRATKPHDGLIDALLLSEYAKRKL